MKRFCVFLCNGNIIFFHGIEKENIPPYIDGQFQIMEYKMDYET